MNDVQYKTVDEIIAEYVGVNVGDVSEMMSHVMLATSEKTRFHPSCL